MALPKVIVALSVAAATAGCTATVELPTPSGEEVSGADEPKGDPAAAPPAVSAPPLRNAAKCPDWGCGENHNRRRVRLG